MRRRGVAGYPSQARRRAQLAQAAQSEAVARLQALDPRTLPMSAVGPAEAA
ncbi:hypothetical protein [Streptomyces formicae]|uniref:Uncharacterized protein n=1 Tax=Streptomyces formicae TaxID=1616117 RepID=A0ABY3WS91_9ACTN|nr:hypothetical protein [Streptomyces formicae]UNM12653.1 hypothetical protein J4032_14990 [Streptomyces formicae]